MERLSVVAALAITVILSLGLGAIGPDTPNTAQIKPVSAPDSTLPTSL